MGNYVVKLLYKWHESLELQILCCEGMGEGADMNGASAFLVLKCDSDELNAINLK